MSLAPRTWEQEKQRPIWTVTVGMADVAETDPDFGGEYRTFEDACAIARHYVHDPGAHDDGEVVDDARVEHVELNIEFDIAGGTGLIVRSYACAWRSWG